MIKPVCVICGCDAANLSICTYCEARLPLLGKACVLCAIPLPLDAPTLCGPCQRRPPPVIQTRCLFAYAEMIPYLLTRYKFNQDLTHGHLLSILLKRHFRVTDLPSVIVPVPLHEKRLTTRGFNQSCELITPLAQLLGVPVDTSLCKRTRDTPDQVGLSAAQRRRNLRNAFTLTTATLPAHIALFDDVITTGATMLNIARLFAQAGVQHIEVWALARTL